MRQPTASLISIAVVTLLAMFGVGFLLSVAGFSPISLLLVPLLGALAFFGYRAVTISVAATAEGITVRNLSGSHVLMWSEVGAVTVGPRRGGRGSSVIIERSDGPEVSVEATWSPWYAIGEPLERRNHRRCTDLVEALGRVRSADTR